MWEDNKKDTSGRRAGTGTSPFNEHMTVEGGVDSDIGGTYPSLRETVLTTTLFASIGSLLKL